MTGLRHRNLHLRVNIRTTFWPHHCLYQSLVSMMMEQQQTLTCDVRHLPRNVFIFRQPKKEKRSTKETRKRQRKKKKRLQLKGTVSQMIVIHSFNFPCDESPCRHVFRRLRRRHGVVETRRHFDGDQTPGDPKTFFVVFLGESTRKFPRV